MRRKAVPGSSLIAVAYLRVSTSDQRLEQQRDSIERWAASQGVRVVAWCQDVGVSGAASLDERPAFLEALAALREHKAGLLIAAKRDRLARDVSTAAAIERLAQEAGARVVTADGLDPSDSPEGQLMRAIVDAMAQYERALIRARTKAAMAAKSARGEVVGQVPFGFERRGRLLVEHLAEQRALSRMAALRSEGVSNVAIAAKLTAEGHLPRGQRWHVTSVQRALRKAG
jgi:site-specific DNA recombinase